MNLESTIAQFESITLKEMDKVKLMNRTDRKYWFHRDHLSQILTQVADKYYILEIDSERNMPYATTYYDTLTDQMYGNHHRGKRNRYKIRRRSYLSSQSSFLEVKFKNNKGRTIKVRKPSPFCGAEFDEQDQKFIQENTPYIYSDLRKTLENSFSRLMLVSKAMNERCTIDSSLKFASSESSTTLSDLVIVEVKSDGRSHSPIIDALNSHRLKPSGFSKYCMGRSLTDKGLKHNNFKEKQRTIDKIINNPINRETA